jgi:hypothetical protein
MWPVFSPLQLSEFFLCSVCWVFWLWCAWWCFSFGPDGLVFCKLPVPGWLSLSSGYGSFLLLFFCICCQCLQIVTILLLLHPWFMGLVFSWSSRYHACSIHNFLAFFHDLLLVGLISYSVFCPWFYIFRLLQYVQ